MRLAHLTGMQQRQKLNLTQASLCNVLLGRICAVIIAVLLFWMQGRNQVFVACLERLVYCLTRWRRLQISSKRFRKECN